MIVWLLEYEKFPGDFDSREETLGIFASIESITNAYPDIIWMDVSEDHTDFDPETAYMGFENPNDVRKSYNANYWASKWEVVS